MNPFVIAALGGMLFIGAKGVVKGTKAVTTKAAHKTACVLVHGARPRCVKK